VNRQGFSRSTGWLKLIAMSSPRIDIISIGTLARNRLWNESEDVRSAHATTTLVRSTKLTILIDPGLPAPALAARLFERTGLTPGDVDVIFLTNFRPARRGGLALFPEAKILIHSVEQEAAIARLTQWIDESPQGDEDHALFRKELRLLKSLDVADDKLADGVDLFPLFGQTPGTCGLLVSAPTTSTLITGDAVPTREHFLAGQVLPDAFNIKAAQESMAEAYEIADLIVPGYDNIFQNPRSVGV